MRLSLLILFLALGASAAQINFYSSFDDGTYGSLVDNTNLRRSVVSEGTGWQWLNATLQKTFTSNSVAPLGAGFTIYGTNWAGAANHSVAYRTERPPNNEVMILGVPTSSTNKMIQVAWGCMVRYDLTNSTASQVVYDHIVDGYFYFQVGVNANSDSIFVDIEGTPTSFAYPAGPVVNRHWYWVAGLSDMINGVASIHVYDAENNFSDLGDASVAIPISLVPGDQSFNMTFLEIGGVYSSLPSSPGYMNFNDLVLNWDEPMTSYPLLPVAPTPPPSANGVFSFDSRIITRVFGQ
jgi:hypothetical protein